MEDQVVQEIGDVEEEFVFEEIDKLQNMNINVADINKLKEAGIRSIKGVLSETSRKLCQIKGLSDAKVEKIKEAAYKIRPLQVSTASVELERRHCVQKIQTGSAELDKLLGGGLQSQSITEIHGEWRCGKTQLCHTMCITAQLQRGTYGGGKVVYLDTEGTFRPERLEPICNRFGLDYQAALENIFFLGVTNSEQQSQALALIAGVMADEPGVIKLLIVDSIMALFRVDYSGRGELAERQQSLAQMLSKLKKLGEEFNVAVLVTNQMTADPGATLTFVPDPKKPVGGNILAHSVQTRLLFKKGRGEERIAKLVDSPELPEAEASFFISPGGIADSV